MGGNSAACPAVVVMAPTRELASQIHVEARRFTFNPDARQDTKLRAVVVYGEAPTASLVKCLPDTFGPVSSTSI